ncbi:hypothetical protein BH10PLA2_BH10PLA2_20290 [soil metagenome]
MPHSTQKLLGAALRAIWETGHSFGQKAIESLTERVPGASAAEYADACLRAAELDAAAFALADAWFDNRGKGPYPSVSELRARLPGFDDADYVEAINKNVIWARK